VCEVALLFKPGAQRWSLIQKLFFIAFPQGVSTNFFFSVRGKNNFDQPGAAKGVPQREPVTQATRGIACPKPSEEPQVSTFVAGGSLCALRRHLLAGQVFFESKNLTANPFNTSFERRIEELF
jgi:hypothetical protein